MNNLNLKNKIKEDIKEDIIEEFHGGGSSGDSKWRAAWPQPEKSTRSSQYKCIRENKKVKTWGIKILPEGERPKNKFAPTDDQQSEYSAINPIWFILNFLNVVIDLLIDLFAIFFWFVKLIFWSAYNSIVPGATETLSKNLGFNAGKKYCVHFTYIRYLFVILCPPAGVFMAEGLRGWVQILVCCVASLFYYFPGLVYALIVINRSEVADYMKKTNSLECADDGLTSGLLISDKENQPKCSATVGMSCTPDGSGTIGGDIMKEDCCVQPELDKDGKWKIDGKETPNYEGKTITSFEMGETYCRNDTKKIKFNKGICVWKATHKPG